MFRISPILFHGVPIGGISADVLFYTARVYHGTKCCTRHVAPSMPSLKFIPTYFILPPIAHLHHSRHVDLSDRRKCESRKFDYYTA